MKYIYLILLMLNVIGFQNSYSMEKPSREKSQEQLNKALFKSVISRNANKVKELLDEGANANTIPEFAWLNVPLDQPIYLPERGLLYDALLLDNYDPEIVKLLLEHGANVNKVDRYGAFLHNIIESINSSKKANYQSDYEKYLEQLRLLATSPLLT